jgi:type IV pilus assembly protein PilC
MQNYLEWFINKFIYKLCNIIKNINKINNIDINTFIRQFTVLIAAGVPLAKSLNLLEESQDKIDLRLLIYSIKKEVLSGKQLHESLNYYPKYFDKLLCQLILIGERTGKLDYTLNTITAYQEKSTALHLRIKQALFYPCIIMITACLVCTCLFLFVIPKFADLFQDFNQSLPIFTKFIFYISYLFQDYIKYILLFIVINFIIFIYNKTKIKSGLFFIFSSLPVIKPLLKKIRLVRFASTLAITFAAGIPITEALLLSSELSHDEELSHILANVRHQINNGLQLYQAMKVFSYFPLLMIQMIKIGEETGTLEHMLYKIASFMESEVDQTLHNLSKLLEPLIMVVLGVLIGGLIIGIYLPIFKLGAVL